MDRDNDGLPDYWEDARLLSRTFTATDDTDGDGRTNLDEYSAGTDPLNTADCLELRFGRNALNEPIVTFTARAITGPGYGTQARRYRLESSTNLTTGAWTPVTGLDSINANNITISYSIPAGSRAFYRAVVWLQ